MSDIIDTYNENAEAYAKGSLGKEDRAELEKLKSLIAPHARVLDLGCAAGRDTRILKDMGFDAVGSDLAERLLEMARKENPDITFVLADMRDLPFDDHSFDAVWANAVLHHVNKAEMVGVLREFWRIVAPGGVVYIHTKAGEGVLQSHEAKFGGMEREFELVTTDELDDMLTKVGYSKLSLDVKESRSRRGLFWVSAFYKKQS